MTHAEDAVAYTLRAETLIDISPANCLAQLADTA